MVLMGMVEKIGFPVRLMHVNSIISALNMNIYILNWMLLDRTEGSLHL